MWRPLIEAGAQAGFRVVAFDQIVAVLAGPARRLVSHTRFMADSREKYKYETVSLAPLRQRTR